MQNKRILYVWSLALVIALGLGAVESIRISLPDRCRSEGRITLSYKQDGQTIKHHMAFTESIDTKHLRSVISIGYISHDPAKYHARAGSPIISVDSNGRCSNIVGSLELIPELSWFLDHLMPNLNLDDYLSDLPHLVGPSGLFAVLEKLNKGAEDKKWQADGTKSYRNVPCNVHSKTIPVPGQEYQLKFEIYFDSRLEKSSESLQYFTLIVTTVHDKSNKQDHRIQETSATIDFYHIESADEDITKFEKIRNEFNLPLGRACSEFLEPVDLPESLKSKMDSFSMSFRRNSVQDYILLAYDHRTNFLRREITSKSATVWDLNEDLMYHSEPEMKDKVSSHMKSCSVVKIADENLGPALKPYEVAGRSIDILKMIGANQIKFMGRSTVRDMPCRIYETILPEAPYIFGLVESRSQNAKVVNHDYIVQFHALDGTSESLNKEEAEHKKLPSDQFWPARIVLFKRHKDNDVIELVEQLDVYDFHWSLFGWDKKSVEMFMAPDCFDDEDEQVRLNLMISFEKIHDLKSKPEDKLILVYNKFRLEYELMQQVLNLFKASQAHVVEYELKLRQNHVNLNLVLADRRKASSLAFQGHGKLPDSYQSEATVSVGLTEEDCIKQSSLIEEISVVMYCEPGFTKTGESLCSAVSSIPQPTIENESSDSVGPKCRVYRLYAYGQMIRSTSNIMSKATQLYDIYPSFEANLPGEGNKTMKLAGRVMDYDISHEVSLIVVNHYAFASPREQPIAQNEAPLVKFFDNYPVESTADCSRLCNLDVTCRSYSYCSQTNSNESTCILSGMDIRDSKLQSQLVKIRGPITEGQQVTVNDNVRNEFKIIFSDRCDMYERNQLNMFRQTEEIIHLQYSMAKQFKTTPTTFECAKQSVNMELKMPDHHLAMFAYCAATGTCLLDESLFESGKMAMATSFNSTLDHQQITCRVYRKKYQTYFKVSPLVLKRDKISEQQVELALQSVEECARACWIKFGHVCTSFDYAPGSCLLNQQGLNSNDVQWEARHNYLHYERDMGLDQLRREHLIGKHKLLDTGYSKMSSFWSVTWIVIRNLFTYTLVLFAFVYGLAIGKRVNDKLESVTILRQSISAGAGIRANQLSEFSIFNNPPQDNELYGEPNAIRLEDIKGSP